MKFARLMSTYLQRPSKVGDFINNPRKCIKKIVSLWIQTLSEKVLNPPNYCKLYPQHFLRRYLDSMGIYIYIITVLYIYTVSWFQSKFQIFFVLLRTSPPGFCSRHMAWQANGWLGKNRHIRSACLNTYHMFIQCNSQLF